MEFVENYFLKSGNLKLSWNFWKIVFHLWKLDFHGIYIELFSTNGILFPWNLWKTISQVESYFPLMEFCFPQVEFYYPWTCGKLVFHGISENYFPLMEAYVFSMEFVENYFPPNGILFSMEFWKLSFGNFIFLKTSLWIFCKLENVFGVLVGKIQANWKV